jgi:bifunctional oligoribonuclease and PAP phosphatase NrnA
MIMSNPIHNDIRDKLQNAQKILIISHVRADGDAVGSVLGLGLTLQAAGKSVQMLLPDGMSRVLRYLPGCALISSKPEEGYELSIVVDSADLGRIKNLLGEKKPDINIDHHPTNLYFANTNLVIPEAESTSGIIAEYLPLWGFTIPIEAAQALLTGIITDTIGFRTPNVTTKTLHIASILMEKGISLSDLYNRALVDRSFEAVRYWGHGLMNVQREGCLVWTSLTLDDRQLAEYPGNDDADLINLLSAIEGAEIAVIFIEQKSGKIKVSWRSRLGWDISKIAVLFNGGGHAAASGAEITGKLQDVQAKVLEATRALIVNNNNLKHAV